jgi:hypothetical protein
MSHTVRDSDEGAIRSPAEVLAQIKPHTRFSVEAHDGTVILRPEGQKKLFWVTATPKEWVKDFRQRVASYKGGPGLPDEAVSRESIYE